MSDELRFEPGNLYGFHLVDVESGGERVFIPYIKLDDLIQKLRKINFEHKAGIKRPNIEEMLV